MIYNPITKLEDTITE